MFFFPRAEDRSPWGDFWFTPVGARTATGQQVTGENAMRHAAVYACVRVLAETFAMLPFSMSRMAGETLKAVTDHWLYRLLSKRPNDFQTPFEWSEMMIGHLALRGNCYQQILSNGAGEVTQLIPLHPDRVKQEVLDNGRIRYRVRSRDGTETVFPAGQIWHIKGLSSDGLMGLSPIELASQTIGLGLGVQEYGSRFFQNDARPGGGWIEHPSHFKDKESREIFKTSWQESNSGINRHKTSVLEWGMKYHDLPIKNNDSQFLETRQFQVIDIARIFRVPPHLVMDLTRGTFSNIEQQSLEFMAYTMAPWAERLESSIEFNFLPDEEDWTTEFDMRHLMRGDSAARAGYYTSGINAGWLTRNEAREAEGMNKLPGLDEPLTPMNMAGGAKPPAPPPPAEASAQRVVIAAAERVVRKEVAAVRKALERGASAKAVGEFYEAHIRFVSEAFAVSEQRAQAWCANQVEQLKACADAVALDSMLRDWESAGPARLARAMYP
ncbi:MAG TPA: phage portal protein [Steroidobacteraceae bacterium]